MERSVRRPTVEMAIVLTLSIRIVRYVRLALSSKSVQNKSTCSGRQRRRQRPCVLFPILIPGYGCGWGWWRWRCWNRSPFGPRPSPSCAYLYICVCIAYVDSSINRHNRLMVLRSYILRFLGIPLGRSSGIECWETMRKMWGTTGWCMLVCVSMGVEIGT